MNRALLALIIPVFAAAACGGSVFNNDGSGNTGDGGATGDGGSGGDAGGDGGNKVGPPGCPASMPNDGVACAPEGIECEYGTNNGACGNPTTSCTGGVWKQPLPTPGVACLPSDKCPSSKSGLQIGAACGDQDEECNYSDGRCTCGYSEGLVQVFPDGGGAQREWQCEQPAEGCPAIRPRIGSSCSNASQSCTYGDCAMPDSVDIQCVDGTWQNEPYACAG